MGITVASTTITLENRYQGLSISKNMDTGEVTVSIVVAEGFYDANGKWNTINTRTEVITGDAVLYLLGITPSALGLTTDAVGDTINTLIYAVLSGQIRLDASVTVNLTDANGTPLTGQAVIKKGDVVYAIGQVPGVLTVPLLLNATLEVTADGFQPFTKTYSLLQGDVVEDVTLTPAQQTTV